MLTNIVTYHFESKRTYSVAWRPLLDSLMAYMFKDIVIKVGQRQKQKVNVRF